MESVKSGDRVQIHFTGRLENGAVIGSSDAGPPAEFVAGSGNPIAGLADAVIGMQVGEKKTVVVPPESGFGEHAAELQREVPREILPPETKIGDQLVAKEAGQEKHFWVRHIGDQSALLDGNHPLAGQTLIFDIELVGVGADGSSSPA